MSALQDFKGRVEEVCLLLDRVAPGWWPERLPEGQRLEDTPQTMAGTLSRSSIVLLVSYFEGFLKDLSDEALDEIADAGVAGARLSDRLRGYAMLRHVQTLRGTEDPAALWQCVSQMVVLAGVYTSESTVRDEYLPRDELKRAMTSIEPKKINELLRALGDEDLNTGPMSVHGQRLRGLKQVRDNAVHGNEQELPSLAYGDVRSNVELLLAVAKDLESHVAQLISVAVRPA